MYGHQGGIPTYQREAGRHIQEFIPGLYLRVYKGVPYPGIPRVYKGVPYPGIPRVMRD